MKAPKDSLPWLNVILAVLGLVERLLPAFLVHKNAQLRVTISKVEAQKRILKYELNKKDIKEPTGDDFDVINEYLEGTDRLDD